MNVKQLKFRYNIASMMVFEQVTKQPFALDGSITNLMLLVWSVIEANNPGAIEFKAMLDHFDEHPEDMDYLVGELNKQLKVSNSFADGEEKKTLSAPA